jgi:hypothetical protein
MAQNPNDLSDLGATPVDSNDLSDLGGVPAQYSVLGSMLNSLPNAAAIYRGALKSAGEGAINIANKGIDLVDSANAAAKNPIVRFNIPKIPDVFKNYSSDLLEQNPFSSALGEGIGNAYLNLPASTINPFGTAASGAAKAAQFIGNAATQGVASQAIQNPNSKFSDYVSAALASPVYQKAFGIVGNTIGRTKSLLSSGVDAIKNQGSQLYNDAHAAADAVNYKTIPNNAKAYAENMLDEINQGSKTGASLSDPSISVLKKALQDYSDVEKGTAGSNAFSLKDTHNQMRQLSSKIEQLYRSGDSYNAGIVSGLKDALVSDIEPSVAATNDPDLANKFFKAQNFYKNEVVPAKNFPTSGKGVLGDLSIAYGLAGLPEPLSVAAAAGLGESGALSKTSLTNAGRRFFSTMQGGPSSVLTNPVDPISKAIATYLAGNNFIGDSGYGK